MKTLSDFSISEIMTHLGLHYIDRMDEILMNYPLGKLKKHLKENKEEFPIDDEDNSALMNEIGEDEIKIYLREKGYWVFKDVNALLSDERLTLLNEFSISDIVSEIGKSELLDEIGITKCKSYFSLGDVEYIGTQIQEEWLFGDTQRAILEIGVFKFQKLMDAINYSHLNPKLNKKINGLI